MSGIGSLHLALTLMAMSAGAEEARPLPADLDALMRAEVDRLGGTGAAVALVIDGQIAHTAGYGLADRGHGRPVEADTTVFGLASTTKTFTALAAVLLANEGLISLDRPLDPPAAHGDLAARAGRPTLARLLTHTAGLEDVSIGSAARSPENLRPLQDYLQAYLHDPVMPAGELSSYSNVGYALAGHVLERASGEPLSRILATRVFDPLGMSSTSLAQPLPEDLQARRAIAYQGPEPDARPVPRIYFNDYPASGLFGTATDMGRFHAALLGHVDPLRPAVVERMTSTAHRNHPELPGLTLGFAEAEHHGVRTLRHGGDWQDYSNAGYLAPERGVALFVAFAHPDGGPVAEKAWALVLERLVAEDRGDTEQPPSESVDVGPTDPDRFAGTFRRERYSRHTIAKLGILTGQVLQADVSADGGQLRLWGQPLEAVASRTFRRPDSLRVGMRTDAEGRATHLFFGSDPHNTYRRLRWYEGATLQAALLGSIWSVLGIVLLGSGVRGRRRRATRSGSTLTAPPGSLLAMLGLAWLVLPVQVGILAMTDPWALQYGLGGVLRMALAAGWLVPTALLVTGAWTVRTHGVRPTGPAMRPWLFVVLLAGYAAHLLHWNLIGS